MALSLQMVQRLWPTKFAFWPKGWLLPAELGKLERWMRKHPTETVRAGQYGVVQGNLQGLEIDVSISWTV